MLPNWPDPPEIILVPYPFTGVDPVNLGNITQQPASGQPAIVIGLGKTGEIVIRQWLRQLVQASSGNGSSMQALVLDEHEMPNDTSIPFRYLRLTNISGIVEGRSKREEKRSLFRQEHNIREFQEWLVGRLGEFHHDISVILVFSIADPIGALLGDILQILRLQPGSGNNPYLRVSALLTTELPDTQNTLEQKEFYAALREITRMSVGGIHPVEKLPGLDQNFVPDSLLDDIFLTGSGSGIPDRLDLSAVPFELGAGQALAEALFILLHPDGRQVWEHHQNNNGRAVINTYSIASLVMPGDEMADYVAARLALAGVFGEKPGQPGEGLLIQGETGNFDEFVPVLVRRWFSQSGATHLLFDAILSVTNPAQIQNFPNITKPEEFIIAFQTQLSIGLIRFLNGNEKRNHLNSASAALVWLGGHLSKCQGWLQDAWNLTELRIFIEECGKITENLKQQVEAWMNAVGHPIGADAGPASSWGLLATTSNWANPRTQISSQWQTRNLTTGSSVGNSQSYSLRKLLEEKLIKAEDALKQAGRGQIRHALTTMDNEEDGLNEVKRFYEESIRPELSQYGMADSESFRRVRERLAWYVRISPGQQAKLLLICLPASSSGNNIPPVSYYSNRDIEKLSAGVYTLAFDLARIYTSNLSQIWFKTLLDQRVDFLKRAAVPLLKYQNGTEKHTYLFAGNVGLTGEYKKKIFPDTYGSVNEISGVESNRITAMTIWPNISLGSITKVRETYKSYKSDSRLHLHAQERNAAILENRIKDSLKLSYEVNIPPNLTMCLSDPQLVTLFCQALFGGIISLEPAQSGIGYSWTLAKLGIFPALALSVGVKDIPVALEQAFRKFSLELPHPATSSGSPADHFGDGKNNFLSLLHQSCWQHRQQPDFPQCDPQLVDNITMAWQSADEYVRAFSAILAIELKEPGWEKWKL
jgi:hypothetical protein